MFFCFVDCFFSSSKTVFSGMAIAFEYPDKDLHCFGGWHIVFREKCYCLFCRLPLHIQSRNGIVKVVVIAY